MNDLIERLERAEEGARDLDYQIFCAQGWVNDTDDPEEEWYLPATGAVRDACPRFTTSLDAAMTLVPEGLTRLSFNAPIPAVPIWGVSLTVGKDWVGYGKTKALALCIAALKAKGMAA